MSAETLRRAAGLMRERAEAATPGRWHPFGTSIGSEVDGCTCHGGIAPYGHEQYCGVEGPVVTGGEADMRHIASWHPAVALAVADWLDVGAEAWQISDPNYATSLRAAAVGHRQALVFARAYLGESA